MKKCDLIPLINFLLCILIAFIWTYVLIVPGLILIDSITNNIIYRYLYIAITCVVGGVLTAIIIAKGLLLKE